MTEMPGIDDKRYLVVSIMVSRSVAVELHPEYFLTQSSAADYLLAHSASRSHVGALA
jgi:hypothetical protein